jgi:hypothetical protein
MEEPVTGVEVTVGVLKTTLALLAVPPLALAVKVPVAERRVRP